MYSKWDSAIVYVSIISNLNYTSIPLVTALWKNHIVQNLAVKLQPVDYTQVEKTVVVSLLPQEYEMGAGASFIQGFHLWIAGDL